MKLLDRYIIKYAIISILSSILVILIVLIIGNVFKDILRKLADRPGIDLFFIIKFMLMIIPSSLGLAIPFSFLLSVLLTFKKLSSDNELISMKMSGLSLERICYPIWILAIIFTIICMCLNVSLIPWSKLQIKKMTMSIVNQIKKDPMILFPNRKIITDFKGFVIYVEKDKENNIKKFQLMQTDKQNHPKNILLANDSKIESINDSSSNLINFEFENANFIKINDDNVDTAYMGKFPLSLSMKKIIKKIGGSNSKNTTPKRMSLKVLIKGLKNKKTYNKYLTEINIRFALSMSCLCFAIIAAPLGISSNRSNKSTGIIIAMGVFIMYYVLFTLAKDQKNNIDMYPHILIWIPNVICFTLGLMIFYQKRKS